MTSSGLDPVTFQLVAYDLNQLCYLQFYLYRVFAGWQRAGPPRFVSLNNGHHGYLTSVTLVFSLWRFMKDAYHLAKLREEQMTKRVEERALRNCSDVLFRLGREHICASWEREWTLWATTVFGCVTNTATLLVATGDSENIGSLCQHCPR
jgi:hypothetical protein